MNQTGEVILCVLAVLFLAGVALWVVVLTVRKADEPGWMIVKWVVTALVVTLVLLVLNPMLSNSATVENGLGLLGLCLVIMIVTWRHSLTNLIATPFASLFDGGSAPPEPRPFYSVARARQKQGRHLEAVAEVQRQLARFPTDVEGQFLLAELQAEQLHDLPAAGATIAAFCQQPGHAAPNIAFALYSLADWQLQIGKDRDAARRALEQVIELLPGTEFALGAAQRVAHLGEAEMLLAPEERRKFVVTEAPRNLGLQKRSGPFEPSATEPEQLAAEYVRHLQQHPLDTEAREKLAVIYADHYGRLDLATEELEQMIAHPNQPARLVVHWLNLLADLEVRSGADYETVRQTIQRIIDRDPRVAAAEIARKRLALLRLEFKANEKKAAVKLGTYEQRLGLKHGPPPGLYGPGDGPRLPRR